MVSYVGDRSPSFLPTHKCVGYACPLQLGAHAGILPHKISFIRGGKHNYVLPTNFFAKEVKYTDMKATG